MIKRAWSYQLRSARQWLGVLLLVASAAAFSAASAEPQSTRLAVRAVDGDTLVLDGDERVRLIGVDTPESVHPNKPIERFGKEASAFTRRMAEGKEVRLEYDPETASHDRYGRTLAYVYLPDGSLLNLEIVKQGYGHAYTRFPFSKMEEFRAAERQAREAQRGLWAQESALESKPAPSGTALLGDDALSRPSQNCTPRAECCRVCSKGKACGNSCISQRYTCRKGRGCACDAAEVCR